MQEQEKPQGLLFVVSGPAGVGKDVTLQALKTLKLDLHFVVTATTRPRRWNEEEGQDYYFVSEERFQEMIESSELLEYAIVHGQHYYGIPKDKVREALRRGQDAIMRIDVQGADTIRRLAPETVFIFLCPNSLAELEHRLRERHTEHPDDVARRLANAPREMAHRSKFDYTVVNADGKLDETVANIAAIIRAERCRTKRRQIVL